MSAGISIGVVGGGASAVCLIDAVARLDGPPGSLTVFEPSAHLWRGRAYQVDAPALKVNALPDDMSVRAGDLGHFERWLADRDRGLGRRDGIDPRSGARFVSRSVYGQYLEHSAHAALTTLRQRGWRIDLVGSAVTAARRTAERVLLHTGHGAARAFDYVVLCVGGDGPKDVFGLRGTPGFVQDPYPVADTLREVDPQERIAVIGSGLTAVDLVLALDAQGHRGPISLLSRRGVLPGVRQRYVPFELEHITPERMRALARVRREVPLPEIVEIVRAELRDAGAALDAVLPEITRIDQEDPVARLRRQLADVDSPDLGLRILQRAVPETGPDIWPLLPEQDREHVLRHHYRTVMSLCCPMPPSSAAVLLELVDAGRLEVRSGLRTVGARPSGGFEVVTEGSAFRVDRVFNAVNAAEDRIPTGAAGLVASLTAGRAAVRHRHGGLDVVRATSRMVVDGEPDARLYGLGNITSGSLFFTFGVPSLVDRAVDIAEAVHEHARGVRDARAQGLLLRA
ncbi:hypothetical protein GCM10009759_18000 [Kitasatospora saccharophila]|uniref:FAD-dependent urate hydroxylase HpyO/Asp monooxygenase CreE-like FAD/NAD(P)-binding domain-containing protein n=1 Tax=Kitasatospora saccharophila TaxID=407973 RepID=A0ABP5I2J8_9ACTN